MTPPIERAPTMDSRTVATLTSLFAGLALCCPVHADYPWMFVQIVCAPTLGYFSIRRITVMNLPNKGPYLTEGLEPGAGISAALRRENLIFDSDGLKTEPFTCSVPAFTPPPGWGGPPRASFKVEVVGHHDRHSEESSYCKIADNAEVLLDGRSLGLIPLNPCASGDTPVIIEVAHNGVELTINKCVEPSIFEDPRGNKIVCNEKPFNGGAR
jgi:hypothetical protein